MFLEKFPFVLIILLITIVSIFIIYLIFRIEIQLRREYFRLLFHIQVENTILRSQIFALYNKLEEMTAEL